MTLFTLVAQAETKPKVRPPNLNVLTDPAVKGGPQINRPCLSCNHDLQGLTLSFFDSDADCTDFIHRNGAYGPWGTVAETYLDNLGPQSHMFKKDRPGMTGPGGICPNWNTLTFRQKKHFWVWTLASLAWDESTCKASSRNSRATDGVAVGLLQLPEAKSSRSWRGPNCKVKSVADATNNIKCGLDILSELMLGKEGEYKSNGKLYGSGSSSYWANFRQKKGGDAGSLIREFSACKF